jgi:16S rRNA (uracil1498-N3)-methyltransferase
MSIPHFFLDSGTLSLRDEIVSATVSKETIEHMHTLRLKPGEHIVLADSPGHGWEVALTATPNKKTGLIEGRIVSEKTSGIFPSLTLVQGISTADRMDQTIRQTTELGICRILPLESERSTVHLTNDSRLKKQERWTRIAKSAAEQSGQLKVPQIETPQGLLEALVSLEEHSLLFFWEEEAGLSLPVALPPLSNGPIALFIGPEGGFSQQEAELIKSRGAQTVTLGTTILRTETAAVVACALVLYQLGALGAR